MRSPLPSRIGQSAALVAFLTCALFTLAIPAQAHSGVRELEPADGSVLSTPPALIRITYTENVLKGTAQMRLTGPGGTTMLTVATDGPVASAPVPDAAGSGQFTVLWRVTSADGHPISGTFGYTVLGGASTPAGTAATSAAAVSPAASEPAGGVSAGASPDVVSPLDPTAGTEGGGSTSRFVIAGAAVLAALAGIGGLWARNRRSSS
ncbi:MAG: copper resistance protein CopC [Kineosporiaceae bacterium]|nr:copper resistance protein CopC [Kineosporiaceae bacterium]